MDDDWHQYSQAVLNATCLTDGNPVDLTIGDHGQLVSLLPGWMRSPPDSTFVGTSYFKLYVSARQDITGLIDGWEVGGMADMPATLSSTPLAAWWTPFPLSAQSPRR